MDDTIVAIGTVHESRMRLLKKAIEWRGNEPRVVSITPTQLIQAMMAGKQGDPNSSKELLVRAHPELADTERISCVAYGFNELVQALVEAEGSDPEILHPELAGQARNPDRGHRVLLPEFLARCACIDDDGIAQS
jgi:hypothetical protein